MAREVTGPRDSGIIATGIMLNGNVAKLPSKYFIYILRLLLQLEKLFFTVTVNAD